MVKTLGCLIQYFIFKKFISLYVLDECEAGIRNMHTCDCCTFSQSCEKWVKAIGKWLWLPGRTTNQCKAVLLADEKWAVCGSRAMRLATSLLFPLSLLVNAWLCVTAWANLQFAETTAPPPPPKKKLLSRITNQKHRPAVHLWGRSSKKK